MSPDAFLRLLLDGAQVLFENTKVLLVLSLNILGIGLLASQGIPIHRPNREWQKDGVAVLSAGISGFVLLSYGITAISRVWNLALPVLANGLLIVSLLAATTGLLISIKKKACRLISAVSLPQRLLLF
jgi:hypothetical protein